MKRYDCDTDHQYGGIMVEYDDGEYVKFADAESRVDRVLIWLGYWRDKIPPDAVARLQDIIK